MCGRFQNDTRDEPEKFKYRFNINNIDYNNIISSFNIAPSQKISVVLKKSPNSLVTMIWGLNAPWDKEGKMQIINVRSETVFEKNMFKNIILKNRCLIPSTGFYEWQKTQDGKVPYYIGLKGKKIFSFAGVYDEDRCAILTTSPNNLMSKVHNRMPVILESGEEEEWLDPQLSDKDKITKFLDPYDDKEMIAYPISSRVNSPLNNDKDIEKKISKTTSGVG